MAFDVKKIIVPGFAVVANIKGKPYAGVVTGQEKDGAGFIVRLARPDQTILSLMLDSKCSVQCITDDGLAYKFECKLLSKKVPSVGFSYPSGELHGVNVRKLSRTPVSFWVAILRVVTEGGKQKLKPVGEGNLVDMNMGGCRIMTNSKYRVNDTIYLSFEHQEGKESLSFKGKIKQVRPAPHGLIYYGVQYDDPKPEFLKTVQTIIDNPQL